LAAHLSAHDVAAIDREMRNSLAEPARGPKMRLRTYTRNAARAFFATRSYEAGGAGAPWPVAETNGRTGAASASLAQ
jgi:hypothetical protein